MSKLEAKAQQNPAGKITPKGAKNSSTAKQLAAQTDQLCLSVAEPERQRVNTRAATAWDRDRTEGEGKIVATVERLEARMEKGLEEFKEELLSALRPEPATRVQFTNAGAAGKERERENLSQPNSQIR